MWGGKYLQCFVANSFRTLWTKFYGKIEDMSKKTFWLTFSGTWCIYCYVLWNLASLLLDSLLSYVTSGEQSDCKAVYLHVLTTNTTAIHFYERRNFRVHCCLPYYYSINGCPHDGYSYVLYINGGQPSSPLLYPLESLWFILLHKVKQTHVYTVSKKTPFYFCNNVVRPRSILIIFGINILR